MQFCVTKKSFRYYLGSQHPTRTKRKFYSQQRKKADYNKVMERTLEKEKKKKDFSSAKINAGNKPVISLMC